MMKEYGQNSGRQSRSFQNHCKQLITVRDRDYVLLHTHSFVPQLFSVWSSDNVKQGSPLSLSLSGLEGESFPHIFFFSGAQSPYFCHTIGPLWFRVDFFSSRSDFFSSILLLIFVILFILFLEL